MNKLVNELIRRGYLKTDAVIDAFSEINRAEFLPEEIENQSEADVPLPIGFGQTISQPLTVAFMLELLDVKKGQKVLDVGSGSGWTTALLSHIVGQEGKVIAIEKIKELVEFGKNNADKFSFVRKGVASFYESDGNQGFPSEAPFDRILVSASAQEIPQALKDQLKIGGKIVIPVKNSLWCLEKKSEKEFVEKEFPGFSFVPLVVENKN